MEPKDRYHHRQNAAKELDSGMQGAVRQRQQTGLVSRCVFMAHESHDSKLKGAATAAVTRDVFQWFVSRRKQRQNRILGLREEQISACMPRRSVCAGRVYILLLSDENQDLRYRVR